MVKKGFLVLIALFLLLLPLAYSADDQYKPYLHKPTIPEHPKAKLYGKYTTNLFPGAATYSYALEVPKGTNNLQPSLSISYNSQSVKQRPSILGAGWSITQNYVYRDVNFTPSNTTDDEFKIILNGVPYGLIFDKNDGDYHTEDETFIRAQNLSNASNTYNSYWLLTLKDGTQLRFGYNSDSELTSNVGYNYSLKWSLDKIEDTHGNKIFYSYNENPNPQDNGSVYLSQILYNNDQKRRIDFGYEGSLRPDRRRVYEQGNVLEESRRLNDIYVFFNSTLVRRYSFEYITLNNESSLSSLYKIKYIGRDNSSVLHNVTFNYYGPSSYYVNSSTYNLSVTFSNYEGIDHSVRLADLNNDGYIDIVQSRENTATKRVWLNNKTGFNQTSSYAMPEYFNDASDFDKGLRLADLNNDGFTDLILGLGGVRKAWLNNGSVFSESSLIWAPPMDFVSGTIDQGTQLADINGDGRVDLLQARDGIGKTVYLNTGNGWKNANIWNPPTSFVTIDGNDYGTRLADINGDGLIDILQYYNIPAEVRAAWLNNGSGWVNSTVWLPPDFFTGSSRVDNGIRLLDVNGDGLVDLLQDYKNGSATARGAFINTGNGWSNNSYWTVPEPFTADGRNIGRRIGDVNGDGFGDILVGFSDGAGAEIKRVIVRNTTIPFLLKNITTEFGGLTVVNYSQSTIFNNTNDDGISDIGFNVWVVKDVFVDNGLSSDFRVLGNTSYNYYGGLYDYNDSEFRGFNIVNETLSDKSIISHYFFQNKRLKGKEFNTETYNSSGNIFLKTENNYNITEKGGNSSGFIVHLISTSNYQYDDNALNPRIINTSFNYDNYSNIISKTQLGDTTINNDEKYENYSYAINTSAWIIDKIKSYALFDSSLNKIREAKYSYDNKEDGSPPSKGDLTKIEQWLDTGGGNPTARFTYDSFGNLIEQVDALGRSTKYDYGLLDTTSTFPERVTNAFGHATTYTYDIFGNVLTETKNGITKTNVYDTFGRILKEILPYDTDDFPTKSYTYSFDGTAPELEIIKQRTTSNNTIDIYYFYDGFANLVQIKSQNDDNSKQIVKNLFYDGLFRVKEEQNPYFADFTLSLSNVSNSTNKTKYQYDVLSRPISVINPEGTLKQTTYNKQQIDDYDENGNKHTYLLDAYDRIVAVTEYNTDFYIGDNEIYNTTYGYNSADELIKIIDTFGNEFRFEYDSLGRKIKLDDPDLGTWTYTYDLAGNLISQTGGGGNLITGDSYYREYNGLGQLQRVRDGNNITGNILEEYSYDANGDRIKVVRFCYSSDCTNETVYTPYKEWMQIRNSSGTYNFHYIYQDSVLVSRLNPDGTKYFYHPDHLGSTSLITDQNGNVVEDNFFSPYGESLDVNSAEEFRLYTSQFKDSIDCQYYYGARYYNQCDIIFINPDQFIAPYNPQSLNRYSYALNNPYKYGDESGNIPVPIITGIIGGVIGGGINLGVQLYHNQGDFSKVKWGQVGVSAGAGAVAGATFGLGTTVAGTGFAATVGSSAAAGVAGGQADILGENVLEGEEITEGLFEAEDVIEQATIGGISGGVGYGIGRGVSTLSTSGRSGISNTVSKSQSTGIGVVPYQRGMQLEGGVTLYGNKNTAIFHYDLGKGYKIDISHHNLGQGSIKYKVPESELKATGAKKSIGRIYIETGSTKPPKKLPYKGRGKTK